MLYQVRSQRKGRGPAISKSTCSVNTLPVATSTGCPVTVQMALYTRLRATSPRCSFSHSLSARACSFFVSLPNMSLIFPTPRNFFSPAITPFIAIACIEIVGGPLTNTSGPAGTDSTVVVGNSSDLAVAFFVGRGGAGMPMSWQLSAGIPRDDCGLPSTTTVALPMKISLSLVGGLANGPPSGRCGGRAWPLVPAVPRGSPLMYTVAPNLGT